jgi:TonB family protein
MIENLSAAFARTRALRPEVALRWLPAEATVFGGGQRLRAQELSLVTHLLLATLLLVPLFGGVVRKWSPPSRTFDEGPIPLSEWKGARKLLEQLRGGTGGDRSPLPPTKGGLAQFSRIQLAPPGFIKNSNARYTVTPTVVGPPEIQPPLTSLYGLPWEKEFNNSQGPGGGGGHGNRCCSGQGRHLGPSAGYGEHGEGDPGPPGMGVGYPECVYCPLPKFTEEARKKKYQGTVTLLVVITAEGRATNIRVVRGLGMGLDEEAIAAVKNWKFKAALGTGGRPVAVTTPIEVTFRLL